MNVAFSTTIMVFILGASSLSYAIQARPRKPRKLRDRLQRSCLAIKGLSLGYFAKQYVLHNNLQLASRNDIVLRHDLFKNYRSKHKSNNFQCLFTLQLNLLLSNYRNRITATTYCQREGTDNILPVLKESAPLTISIVNHIISRKNAKNQNNSKAI